MYLFIKVTHKNDLFQFCTFYNQFKFDIELNKMLDTFNLIVLLDHVIGHLGDLRIPSCSVMTYFIHDEADDQLEQNVLIHRDSHIGELVALEDVHDAIVDQPLILVLFVWLTCTQGNCNREEKLQQYSRLSKAVSEILGAIPPEQYAKVFNEE